MPAVGGSGSGGSVTAGRRGVGAGGTGVGSGVAVGSAWAVGAGVACSPRGRPQLARRHGRAPALSRPTRPPRWEMLALPILIAPRPRTKGAAMAEGQGRRTQTRPLLPVPPGTWGQLFAGPIPQCVDFVNTARLNKQFVRKLGRPAAWAFSRYEIVTSRKRALCRRGDHHEPRILAVRSRRGFKRESLVIGRLDPARVGGRDPRVKLRDYKFEFTTARRRDRDLVAYARVPE